MWPERDLNLISCVSLRVCGDLTMWSAFPSSSRLVLTADYFWLRLTCPNIFSAFHGALSLIFLVCHVIFEIWASEKFDENLNVESFSHHQHFWKRCFLIPFDFCLYLRMLSSRLCLRRSDTHRAAHGGVSSGSGSVENADRVMWHGLQCWHSYHRLHVVSAVHLLQTEGMLLGSLLEPTDQQMCCTVSEVLKTAVTCLGSRGGEWPGEREILSAWEWSPDIPQRLPAVEEQQLLQHMV